MTKSLKQQIADLGAADLEKVEAALETYLEPNLDLVRQIASHLLFSGGKRLRPLLMIHSARLCGFQTGFEVDFSVIFEYLHAATLLHDDVVDEADIRRGKKAAHRQWSASKVVLTGDFLMSRALDMAVRTESFDIIAVIAHVTREMSQGEIDQLDRKGQLHLTEADYLKIIERKTAVLIQGACRSGALLAGADKRRCEALTRFGYHLGMAFQMVDDLLDYTADAGQLGKNPGADLREGKLTLPLIHALSNASAQDRKWMQDMVKSPVFDADQFARLKDRLTAYGGIEYTRDSAVQHVSTAKACLAEFEPAPSGELLNLIADYVIERKG